MQDGGRRTASSVDAFERMEAKANKALDQAMAHADLNAAKDDASDLADKYGSSSVSVDDELARLKESLNI